MPPLAEALHLMTLALDILDREKAPRHIGAHLDLAIQRLQEALASISPHETQRRSESRGGIQLTNNPESETDQRLSG